MLPTSDIFLVSVGDTPGKSFDFMEAIGSLLTPTGRRLWPGPGPGPGPGPSSSPGPGPGPGPGLGLDQFLYLARVF